MSQRTKNTTKKWEVTEKYPDFKGRKVYVLPGVGYSPSIRMFARAGLKQATSVEDADIVCFLGGADVDPKLYGQKLIGECGQPIPTRDKAEERIYHQCRKLNKTMFGICRGAQFLHVMNGGVLWQHIDGHAGDDHSIYDVDEDMIVMSSSYHHQAMKYNDNMELIALADPDRATILKNEEFFVNRNAKLPDDPENYIEIEVEAAMYSGTKCLCIQGHPECGPLPFQTWSLYKLFDLVREWEPQERTSEKEQIVKTVISQIG